MRRFRVNCRKTRVRPRPSLRDFLRDEQGSATIEFVIWIPWFMLLLMIVVDACFLYLDLNRMENAARDGARRVSTGQFTPTTVIPWVKNNLPDYSYNITGDCSTVYYACVTVTRDTSDILVFANIWSGWLWNQTFGATIKMRWEPGWGLPSN